MQRYYDELDIVVLIIWDGYFMGAQALQDGSAPLVT